MAIGEDDYVFLPGYGAPFVMDVKGNQRQATMEDYDNFCKLIQTSPFIDMNGWMMVEPADMPHETVHLDLNLSNMLLCDKPFMGSPASKQGAIDGIEMAKILFGGQRGDHGQDRVRLPDQLPVAPYSFPMKWWAPSSSWPNTTRPVSWPP